MGSQMNSGRRKNRKSWQTAKMTEIVWHNYEEDYLEQDPETEVTPGGEEKLDTFGKMGEQEPLAANRDHKMVYRLILSVQIRFWRQRVYKQQWQTKKTVQHTGQRGWNTNTWS